MPRIVTVRSKDGSNQDVISLVLSQDAIVVGPDGDPLCGVTLRPDQARSLAERLRSFAIEIERQEHQGYRTSSRSFIHLASVVVLHDGSEAGHRAFEAALHLASRSLATLDFVGIFGISNVTGEPSVLREDYEWQKGWLTQLVELCKEQTTATGISFNSRLFPANDPCGLFDKLHTMDFDLVVMPRTLSRFGTHGERLMPSIVSRSCNVLVCP